MTEGSICRKLKAALIMHPRLNAAGAVVHRYVDRYTAGILDLSVSIKHFTLWLELKVEPRKLTKLQEYEVKRLGEAAFVITFSPDGRRAVIDKLAMIGWLTFEQVVEHIVSECLENGIVRGEIR